MQRYLVTRAPLLWIERRLVPIGLISYSLYLWHGPVLMLVEGWGAKYHAYSTPLGEAIYILTVGSLFLFPFAWLSHRVLEVAAPAALRAAVEKRKARKEPAEVALENPGPINRIENSVNPE